MSVERWVPLRWPCGPLEIEQARERDGFTPADAQALEWWGTPGALEILEGTPVNCLVVTWARGLDVDGTQQRALAPLVGAARHRGLSVVGQVAADADLRQAAASAAASGLDALATRSREAVPGLDVLRFGEVKAGDRSAVDFLGIADATWPGMRMDTLRFADAATGPTGPPWIDSNAWKVRLARELMRPQAVWVSFDPPDERRPVRAASYLQAIADAEIHGGRWVVSLDRGLRGGLSRSEDSAKKTWAEIARCLAFFGEHRAWGGYRPVGQLGMISDFAGANEFLSFEVLNLLARQSSLYRIVEKRHALDAPFDGLKAILIVDEAPPETDLARKLYSFAEAGGTLITPPGWEERGALQEHAWPPRYRVFRYGAGRLAVAGEEVSDPRVLAEDAQLLMSHRHDAVRIFNAGTAMTHYTLSEDGASGVLHVVRFMGWSFRMPITVWFRRDWTSARVWRPEARAAGPAERRAGEPGVEFGLDAVPAYCAVEVST